MVTADCDTDNSTAAREICPSSAVAAKYLICRSEKRIWDGPSARTDWRIQGIEKINISTLKNRIIFFRKSSSILRNMALVRKIIFRFIW